MLVWVSAALLLLGLGLLWRAKMLDRSANFDDGTFITEARYVTAGVVCLIFGFLVLAAAFVVGP